jgi:hypothetical protein
VRKPTLPKAPVWKAAILTAVLGPCHGCLSGPRRAGERQRHRAEALACDGHGLIADPHASVARIAAKRRVAVITPAFPLAATRLPPGHINQSGCSTATPDRKPI